jgi:hypothetical protein
MIAARHVIIIIVIVIVIVIVVVIVIIIIVITIIIIALRHRYYFGSMLGAKRLFAPIYQNQFWSYLSSVLQPDALPAPTHKSPLATCEKTCNCII